MVGRTVKLNAIIGSIVSVLIVVAIFTGLIGGAYCIVIPMFFPTYKTALILIFGIAMAALIGGYISYQVSTGDTTLVKIGYGLCYATVVVLLVAYLSLFIILNVRGS